MSKTRTLATVGKVPATVEDPRLKDFLESMRQRINAYEDRIAELEGLFNVEDWHVLDAAGEPSFEASWVNNSGLHAPAGFFKDSFNMVHMRGWVTGGSHGGTVFYLPKGYRPKYSKVLTTYAAANTAPDEYVDVNPDGRVRVFGTGGTHWSFDGQSFTLD